MNNGKYIRRLSKDAYQRYYKRFETLLTEKRNKKTISSALKLLDAIETPKDVLDPPMRRLTDQIFMEDKSGIFREMYKSYLKSNGLNWTKFEVKRLISDDQYELALMTALDGFTKDSEESTDSQLLLRQYHLIKLVQMASERGDTIMLDQLITILQSHKVLSDVNYSNLLCNAISKGDFNTVDLVLKEFNVSNFSDTSLYEIGLMYIANDNMEKAHELMMIMKDTELKFKLSLQLIESMGLYDGFKLLDYMAKNSPIYEQLHFNDVPTDFYQIKETNDFESLTEFIALYNELESERIKLLLLECIFTSLGNLYSGFNSEVFMINFLLKNKIPIDDRLRDIICHNISHINLKLTTFSVIEVFELDKLTDQNLVHLLTPLFNGTEPDLIYVFLIKLIEAKGDIPNLVKIKLNEFIVHTNDRNITYLLEKDSSLNKFKEMINLNFVMRNIENESERTRLQYSVIPGYHVYNFEIDMRVRSKLQI